MKATLRVVVRTEPIDLDRLARMQPYELQRLHQRLFKRAVPSGNSELARRRIAWHVQSEREGGLPESARQHALAIAKEASLRIHARQASTQSPLPHATVTGIVSDHDSRLPMPGSILIKEFRGQTFVVRVLDNGFECDRRRFTSLSAVAKEITGKKWNGFLFFGLTKGSSSGR
ncbi:MAG TPA: DUF2924 domain-containing protein [Bryobacteraceae bacterium]|nr:DUF2924 domain-containing protein [Bryobacteraceae bacterium]